MSLNAEVVADMAAHGISAVRAFEGGEFGAHLVRDSEAREWVCKSTARDDISARLDLAARATRVLRDRGSPVPAYGVRGRVGARHWWLQEVLPGKVARPCSARIAEQLVVLASLHRDGVVELDGGRSEGDGPTSPVSASSIDAILRDLVHVNPIVEEFRRASAALGRVALRTTDIVHGDLHTHNVLSVGDQVTGVFDWDFVHLGDWRGDLVRLAFWSRALVSVDGPGMEAPAAVSADALQDHVPDDDRALLILALLAFEFAFTAQAHPERIPWLADRAREVQDWWR